MDALFHLTMTFAGGYMLLRGLDVKFRWRELFLISFIAGMIDMDHFYRPFGEQYLFFHNVFFIALAPLAAFLIFRRLGKGNLALYSLFMPIFWTGHLLLDMTYGMYGVAILFPLSGAEFFLPDWMNMWRIGTTYAIETVGFAVAIYFGIIFAVLAINEARKTGKVSF